MNVNLKKIVKYVAVVIIVTCPLAILTNWDNAKNAVKYVENIVDQKSAIEKVYSNLEFGESLIRILHLPKTFSRRDGDLTANICGALARGVKSARYRVNNLEWRDIVQWPPRVPPPLFTIELSLRELRQGENVVAVEVSGKTGEPETRVFRFEYDPAPVSLPLLVDWSGADLDVHDGFWEAIRVNGSWRVRPKPGFEDYDRVLLVSGTFAGARRIKTDLIYRHETGRGLPFGFGILPLWGGRPDEEGIYPRRGWNFSLAWYYSHYKGLGMEFSFRYGLSRPRWISTYTGEFDLTPGVKYFLVVEVWPEMDPRGNRKVYRQRMKWWAEGKSEPDSWMNLAESKLCRLPEREYAVALIAHRSQVEFGPVVVESMQEIDVADQDDTKLWFSELAQ